MAFRDRAFFLRVLRRLARLWLAACNRRDRGDGDRASWYLLRFEQLSTTWKLSDDVGCRRLLARRAIP